MDVPPLFMSGFAKIHVPEGKVIANGPSHVTYVKVIGRDTALGKYSFQYAIQEAAEAPNTAVSMWVNEFLGAEGKHLDREGTLWLIGVTVSPQKMPCGWSSALMRVTAHQIAFIDPPMEKVVGEQDAAEDLRGREVDGKTRGRRAARNVGVDESGETEPAS